MIGPLLACPVCFGALDGPLVNGSTLGILTLLAVTVAMLCAFAGFFLTLRRRAAAAALSPVRDAQPVAAEEPAC